MRSPSSSPSSPERPFSVTYSGGSASPWSRCSRTRTSVSPSGAIAQPKPVSGYPAGGTTSSGTGPSIARTALTV